MLALALAGMPSGAPTADESVRQYLDETTAATVTVASEALIFARERTDLAVNARDYISLTAIEVNRSGKRACFWYGYFWTTIDQHGGDPIVSGDDRIVLIADGRPILLRRSGASPRQLGIAAPPTSAPVRTAIAIMFPVDPEILSYVSEAGDLEVQIDRTGLTEQFTLWRDARRELRQFVGQLDLQSR